MVLDGDFIKGEIGNELKDFPELQQEDYLLMVDPFWPPNCDESLKEIKVRI